MHKICLSLCLFLLIHLPGMAQRPMNEQDSAKVLLRKVFDTVEQHSVYRPVEGWGSLESRIFHEFDSIEGYKSLTPRVKALFEATGDHHSFLTLDKKRAGTGFFDTLSIREVLREAAVSSPRLKAQVLPEGYAYLRISGYNNDISVFSQSIQDSLCSLLSNKPKGLIIDLRLNEGGSIYPLFTGMGQVIGNGTFAYWARAEGKPQTRIGLKKGNLLINKITAASVNMACGVPSQMKVAVLLSQITASAGEHLAIALKGRPNTLFIGEKTLGLTSGVSVFNVYGHKLGLSTAFMADRNGTLYKQAVLPDVELVEGDNFDNLLLDTKVNAALNWFQSTK